MTETTEIIERGPVSLMVNGDIRTIVVEPRVTLLDALREELGLTGTKRRALAARAAPAPCMSTVAGSCPVWRSR